MSEVQRTTGYAPDLFSARERDSANVKDKESKVQWLEKIMACVGHSLGRRSPARALKIVAGLEPEKTNAFLQMLAEAATKGDGVEAARRVNAGEPPPADPGPGGAEPSVASRNAPPNSAPSLGTSTSAPPAAPPVAPPAVDLNAPPEPDSPVAAARARARAAAVGAARAAQGDAEPRRPRGG